MSVLHKISKDGTAARGSVVFVHGLGGDAFGTWRRDSTESTFWPRWIAEDLPDIGILSLEYPSAPSAWLGTAMGLPDRATNVLAVLMADGLDKHPLIFVCHSLGGLLVKQVLRVASDQAPRFAGLTNQIRGITFLATPNTGSAIATWMDRLRVLLAPSQATKDLVADSPYLRDLNFWYRDWGPREEIATLVFAESQRMGAVTVVDASSSDPGIPGVRPIPIDADHLQICKPGGRDDLVYKTTLRFIDDCFPRLEQSKVALVSDRSKRIFISYRRRAPIDAGLADYLRSALNEAGHDVFMDVGMQIGVDWGQEIRRRIDWCEFLVVLLSEDAAASEMIQEEVRLAYQRRKEDNTPTILPVRVNYSGELGYALGAYLNRYQHVFWTNQRSTESVLAEIARAIEGQAKTLSPALGKLDIATSDSQASEQRRGKPESVADPRVLRHRPGGANLSDPGYLMRKADRMTISHAADSGVTLVIKAPRQMGKTSLLVRYLQECKKYEKKVAFVDFQLLSDIELDSESVVLTLLANQVLRELAIDPTLRTEIKGARDLTQFFEDVVFVNQSHPITLALDEVDRIIVKPYRESVFAMLRGWDTLRGSHPHKGWDRLDVVLVVSTEPSFFIQEGTLSPFNVTDPIRLECFDSTQMAQMNVLFGSPLGSTQLDTLYNLVGGHPHLTRLAFYRLASDGDHDLDSLVSRAADDEGPFGDHLRAKLSQLQQRPELAGKLARLIRSGVPPEDAAFHRLHAAGLILRKQGRIIPANELYATFFARVLL